MLWQLDSYMTLGKLRNLFMPQFPYKMRWLEDMITIILSTAKLYDVPNTVVTDKFFQPSVECFA